MIEGGLYKLESEFAKSKEELNMLSEDLSGRVISNEEKYLIMEELYIQVENLEESLKQIANENSLEVAFYIELLQKISEGIFKGESVDKKVREAENEMEKLMKGILDKRIPVDEIESRLESIYYLINTPLEKEKIKKYKELYITLHKQAIINCEKQIEQAHNSLKNIKNSIEYNTNIIEQDLQVNISKVLKEIKGSKEKIENERNKLKTLIKAEDNIVLKIKDWKDKKDKNIFNDKSLVLDDINTKLECTNKELTNLSNNIEELKLEEKVNLVKRREDLILRINLEHKKLEGLLNESTNELHGYKSRQLEYNKSVNVVREVIKEHLKKMQNMEILLEDKKLSFNSARNVKNIIRKCNTNYKDIPLQYKIKEDKENTECSFELTKGDVEKSMLIPLQRSINIPLAEASLNNSFILLPSATSSDLNKSSINFSHITNRLLKGNGFYVKRKNIVGLPVFDPLKTEICPPTHCGYKWKHLKLSNDYTEISIGKTILPVKNIIRPIIPQKTAEIIRIQKGTLIIKKWSTEEEKEKIRTYSTCTYYPFTFEVEEERLELIATNHEELKLWVIGINLLIKNNNNSFTN